MAILTNNIITWKNFVDTCFNSMISACCNIDSYSSDVPSKMKAGQGRVEVRGVSRGGNNDWVTVRWYADTANLISTVATSQVKTEWNGFLSAAEIDTRSNKVMSAKDLELATGLFMQFMSFHVKPIYSTRQIYNTVETQMPYASNKYVTGTVTPKYTLSGSSTPETQVTSNDDIIRDNDTSNPGIVKSGFNPDQLMKKFQTNNPISRFYLT